MLQNKHWAKSFLGPKSDTGHRKAVSCIASWSVNKGSNQSDCHQYQDAFKGWSLMSWDLKVQQAQCRLMCGQSGNLLFEPLEK